MNSKLRDWLIAKSQIQRNFTRYPMRHVASELLHCSLLRQDCEASIAIAAVPSAYILIATAALLIYYRARIFAGYTQIPQDDADSESAESESVSSEIESKPLLRAPAKIVHISGVVCQIVIILSGVACISSHGGGIGTPLVVFACSWAPSLILVSFISSIRAHSQAERERARFIRISLISLVLFYVLCAAVAGKELWLQHQEIHVGSLLAIGVIAFMGLSLVLAGVSLAQINSLAKYLCIYQTTDDGRVISLESTASILDSLYFSWFTPFVEKGSKCGVGDSDMWDLLPKDKAEFQRKRFESHFVPKENTSYKWPLFRALKGRILRQAFFGCTTSITCLIAPLFLNRIVNAIENPGSESSYMPFVYAVGMFLGMIFNSTLNNQGYFNGRRVCTRIRAILISEIYRKSLKRAISAADDGTEYASVGQISNLMAVDTHKVREFAAYSHTMISTPIVLFMSIGTLIYFMGWSAVLGVGVMAAMMLVGGQLEKRVERMQSRLMYSRDERVNRINELLQGIRIVKFFAWEPLFDEKISESREGELKNLLGFIIANCLFRSFYLAAPLLVSLATFAAYTVIAKQELTATLVFTALALFNGIRYPLASLPGIIVSMLEARVSMRRIESFLAEQEVQENIAESKDIDKESTKIDQVVEDDDMSCSESLIGFREASFQWYGTGVDSSFVGDFRLSDLNVEFPRGKLTVVMGSTGCGKSSMLMALLGEMRLLTGNRMFPRDEKIAYVAQQAWIQNCTVRENIIFGNPYDPVKYAAVIHACALVRDFETFQGGDMTEIGERGVNLSGGQKQRISLARAAYSDADIVLLDDPLSAVDAPTAQHLFEVCILGLMRNKTRVLVTHAAGLCVPQADYVLEMDNGSIITQGTPESLLKIPRFASYVKSEEIRGEFSQPKALAEETLKKIQSATESTKLIEEEQRSFGSVSKQVYIGYINAAGGFIFGFALVFCNIAVYATRIGQDLWLKKWASAYAPEGGQVNALEVEPDRNSTVSGSPSDYLFAILAAPVSTLNAFDLKFGLSLWAPTAASDEFMTVQEASQDNDVDVGYYLSVYAGIGALSLLISIASTLAIAFGSIHASRKLHAELLQRVLRAPMRFFDVTPLGRILNRFSKDIESIDERLADYFFFVCENIMEMTAILVLICSITPIFIAAVVPIILLYRKVARLYLPSSRDLKRLDSVTCSPIYSSFTETLTGVTTIRAYGQQTRFTSEIERKVDHNHRAFFFLWVANRWLCIRIEFIGALVSLFTGIAVLFSLDFIDAGLAGICLTYAISFSDSLLWLIRFLANLEMDMNSMERVQEYLAIDQEAPAVIEGNRPEESWPREGTISVKELELAYSVDSLPVIKRISFDVNAREKVAIVGRTGAGKSTLSLAFFRFIEAAHGTIEIDGVDIGNIGLRDLRSKITIIPQDPVLFAGTIRSNLDPMSKYTDIDLWTSLKRVHLIDELPAPFAVDGMEASKLSLLSMKSSTTTLRSTGKQITLDSVVAENGANFSQGQRQLLCLARALLNMSRVIILDEATASIDHETDSRIQQTIREEFQNSTVLCIAHRLRTIIDYDRVLVLKHGRVEQYGSPAELIQEGEFRIMCEQSGEFRELMAMLNN